MANKPSSQQTMVKECPSCRMPHNDWPEQKGYTKNKQTYCCQGCAEDTGCTCQEQANEDEGEEEEE